MGGMFGAIGALAALIQRGITGTGQEVQIALFENNVFLIGQHMLQYAMTGKHAAADAGARQSPWAVYDVFTVTDGEQIFLAAVSDTQWQTFCDALGFADLKADPSLATNNQRVRAAARRCSPTLRERLARATADELAERSSRRAGLPYAPIRRPEDLFDDPHLNGDRRPRGRAAARRRAAPGRWRRRRCSRSRWAATASACGCIRRRSASTRASCWPNWAMRASRSMRCTPIRRWPERRDFQNQKERQSHDRQDLPLTMNRRAVLGLGACAAAVAACPALAQGSDKPIRFILPISAGSGVDTIMRAAAPALAQGASASRW